MSLRGLVDGWLAKQVSAARSADPACNAIALYNEVQRLQAEVDRLNCALGRIARCADDGAATLATRALFGEDVDGVSGEVTSA